MENKCKVSSFREQNIAYMNQMLPIQDSFDLMQRDLPSDVTEFSRTCIPYA